MITKILLFALLLACPLMHLFMMRESHKHSDDDENHKGHGCCH
ncbi:MAG: DUF2933 domain-containing protein [Candidatus Zambryskibacteria bacterium]